ncbi:unnamed protein product [Cuscuta campestris]|uniref:Uncharacterized protein n=1 Tax=Cuscuta campestris TaxID=132261 RepID=A0A484NPE7_9ASTE|nr:unnamed protein product [Cuscuta campestris]
MSICRCGFALFNCSQFLKRRIRRSSVHSRPNLNFSPISYLSNEETRYSVPISGKEPSPIVLSRRLLTHSVLAAWLLPSCSGAIEGGGREALELERLRRPGLLCSLRKTQSSDPTVLGLW